MRRSSAWLVVGLLLGLGGCIELPDELPEARFDAGEGAGGSGGGAGGEGGAGGAGGEGGAGGAVDPGDAAPPIDAAPAPEVCNGRDDDYDDSIDEGVRNDCNECGPLPDEVCDGFDNDCDLIIDEAPECACMPGSEEPCGTDEGPCTLGARTCSPDGTWGPCSGIGPQPEACNDIDDNCNGDTDEGVLNACGRCGALDDEVCNGEDDDCDGAVDEPDGLCPCPLDSERACPDAPGVCDPGRQRCTAEGWAEACEGRVMGSAEVCGGGDEDCDGAVDEGVCDCLPGEVGACGIDVGACVAGRKTCRDDRVWGGCMGAVGPQGEACNGLDDDCDGRVDEIDCQCPFGDEQPCGSDEGVCRRGVQTCGNMGWGPCVGAVSGGDELCNGLDDDCRGDVDEDWPAKDDPCAAGVGRCRRDGRIVCTADGRGIRCDAAPGSPAAEACNGADDDCDGRTDEGTPAGPCDTGRPGVCGDGHQTCQNGETRCTQDTPEGLEACNGADDDCDGRTDEGTDGGPCDTGQPGRCAAGTEDCTPNGLVCRRNQNAVDEWCNDRDDDCDGEVDEGLDQPGECATGEQGICSIGIGSCVGGDMVCVGPDPRAETCNGLDDDCNGVVDNGTRGQPCDTGLPAPCDEGRSTCRNGNPGCLVEPTGIEENLGNPGTCNGRDDDCDGAIDEDQATEGDCPLTEFYCLNGSPRPCPGNPR